MTGVATRVIAGVDVPDTRLINKALELAEAELDPVSYNHVVRSWLYGHHISSNVSQFEGRDSKLQPFVYNVYLYVPTIIALGEVELK